MTVDDCIGCFWVSFWELCGILTLDFLCRERGWHSPKDHPIHITSVFGGLLLSVPPQRNLCAGKSSSRIRTWWNISLCHLQISHDTGGTWREPAAVASVDQGQWAARHSGWFRDFVLLRQTPIRSCSVCSGCWRRNAASTMCSWARTVLRLLSAHVRILSRGNHLSCCSLKPSSLSILASTDHSRFSAASLLGGSSGLSFFQRSPVSHRSLTFLVVFWIISVARASSLLLRFSGFLRTLMASIWKDCLTRLCNTSSCCWLKQTMSPSMRPCTAPLLPWMTQPSFILVATGEFGGPSWTSRAIVRWVLSWPIKILGLQACVAEVSGIPSRCFHLFFMAKMFIVWTGRLRRANVVPHISKNSPGLPPRISRLTCLEWFSRRVVSSVQRRVSGSTGPRAPSWLARSSSTMVTVEASSHKANVSMVPVGPLRVTWRTRSSTSGLLVVEVLECAVVWVTSTAAWTILGDECSAEWWRLLHPSAPHRFRLP